MQGEPLPHREGGEGRRTRHEAIPSIEMYPPDETGGPDPYRFVTVDDDVILEPHALEVLVDASARDPLSVIGLMGYDYLSERHVHSEWLHFSGGAGDIPSAC